MERLELKAEIRTGSGKESATRVRNSGLVPAVLYGKNLEENVQIAVDTKEVAALLGDDGKVGAQCTIVAGGKEYWACLKSYQVHPVKRRLLHVDFQALYETQPLTIDVPVKLVGEAKGEKRGGMVFTSAYDILLKG